MVAVSCLRSDYVTDMVSRGGVVFSDGQTSRTVSRAHQALAAVRRAQSPEAGVALLAASEVTVRICPEYRDVVPISGTWVCNRQRS